MINLGKEDGTTEFKESMSQLDKGIMAITAMLNRYNHAEVYIGVRDDGSIIGIQVGKDTVEKIRNRISTMVAPQILPQIDVLESDGKEYIRISCSGYASAYSFNGRYYTREVTSNVQLSPELLARMLLSKGTDPPKDIASPRQDLTFKSFTRYMESLNIHAGGGRGFYESHGLLNNEGAFNLVAYLMSDQNDVPLQVVVFSGTDKSAISSRTDYGRTSLLIGVGNVLDRIRALQVTKVISVKSVRVEDNLFDLDVFREAWINACVHNDWKAMVPPSVFVFDDRIEVQSYGRIPFMLSLDEFYSGKSMPVNKSLFDHFILADYSEQSGHGVRTIVDRYGKGSIVMGDNMVTVTIPFAFVPDWVMSRRQTESQSSHAVDNKTKVLDYLADNRNASIENVSLATGLGKSSVSKIIATLKENGLLRNDGNNRRNEWVRLG